jgi:dTDP-glucose 4,6-dehydratase
MTFKALDNKTLFVTGGAGFIGSNFVEFVLKQAQIKKIFILDKLTYAGSLDNLKNVIPSKKIDLIIADLVDTKTYKAALMDSDYIVHFAAESHVDRSIKSPSAFVESNINGTFQLLELARSLHNPRFLMISTDEVYGSVSAGESLETDKFNPTSVYSASKAAAEHLCFANIKTHSQDIIIARSCNNYGPNQLKEKLIPYFIDLLLNGKKVPIYGDGTQMREWIHVEDNVRALLYILVGGESGEAYNVGGGTRITNLNLTLKLLNLMGVAESSIEFVQDRLAHDIRYALNSQKVKLKFQWMPKIDLDKGLNDTINWYKIKKDEKIES